MAQNKKVEKPNKKIKNEPKSNGFGLFLLLSFLFLSAIAPVIFLRLGEKSDLSLYFLMPALIYEVGLFIAIFTTGEKVFHGDRTLIYAIFLLLGIGVSVQMRLGTFPETFSIRGFLPLTAGIFVYIFIIRFLDAEKISSLLPRLKWFAWFATLGIMAILFVFGKNYRGGLYLPGNFTPTELVKPLFVIFMAAWLAERENDWRNAPLGIPPISLGVQLLVFCGAPLFMGILVKDLGLVLLLCMTIVLLLSAVTRKILWLFAGFILTFFAGWFIQFVSAHARTRFNVWLSPFDDPTGKGWQILQSLSALYAGGLEGTGLGGGFPQNIPIVESDFVYAVLAEEFGLIGCGLVAMAYIIFFLHAAISGTATKKPSIQLLGAGLTSILTIQTILNIGGVTKALPMTGITLPFISYGGFSLISCMIIAGIITAISKNK